jgi:ribose 5-phosphate isomerase B
VMAATKVEGVRAALCVDAETARGARRWNDANVVGLSLRLTTAAVAAEIVDAFLATPVDPGEQRRIDRVS